MSVADTLDPVRSEQFAETLLGHLNGAGLALMISIGHRTGLFDALAAGGAQTADQLAERADKAPRYVREWLGALVTGGIVTYDEPTDRYTLPAEHAAWLTRDASPQNLAVVMQFIAVLGAVEDRIVDCFARGGGVPYEAFERFHTVMAEESSQSILAALEDAILPLVPGLIEKLEAGIDVLDVGCGSGRAMVKLAALFPNSRFVGFDISEEAIGRGRAEAEAKGLTNVRLEIRDVTQLGIDAAYDLITAFDAIHDQARPDLVLAGIRKALRPDGVYLMQDIRASSHLEKNVGHPLAPFFYTISTMHCMTVSLAADGMGLGTCWGEETALEMLSTAGFADVSVETLEHDIQNNYYICRA